VDIACSARRRCRRRHRGSERCSQVAQAQALTSIIALTTAMGLVHRSHSWNRQITSTYFAAMFATFWPKSGQSADPGTANVKIMRSMHLQSNQCMMHSKPNFKLTYPLLGTWCSALSLTNSSTGPSRLPQKPMGQRAATASEGYSCIQCPSTNTATHHWPRFEPPVERDTGCVGAH
jgi:hypothetical protein